MPVLPEPIWTLQSTEIIRHIILNADTIAIAGHVNPDGDSVGSLLSLGAGLEMLGKKVYMLSDDPVPSKYMTLPGASRIVKWCPHSVDLAIAVDCGSKDMLGSVYTVFQCANTILEIDHHHCRIPFGDYSIVDTQVSSAGELVYTLLNDLDVTITENIAWNILTSIIVETNSFRLPDVNTRTFEICAELLKTGIDFYKLTETVYWRTSKATAILTGMALSRCKFSRNGELAWVVLTRRDFEKTNSSETDADSVPEKIRSIQGVKIAILFRETSTRKWRISFRSKDGIDVARLAELFGGGGHLSAAGCTIKIDKKVFKKILETAQTFIDDKANEMILNNSYELDLFDSNTLISINERNPDVLFLETVALTMKKPARISKYYLQ